jgi:DNA-binding HxlR family transcriptional regulator
MDEEMTKKYLSRVPIEMREAIMELNSDKKWAVYIALTLEGKKYFNEIKMQFGANPNTIDTILKSLVAGGLVTKRVELLSDMGNRERSYYQTTKFGLKLMDALYEVVLPPIITNHESFIRWIPSVPSDTPVYMESIGSTQFTTQKNKTKKSNIILTAEV